MALEDHTGALAMNAFEGPQTGEAVDEFRRRLRTLRFGFGADRVGDIGERLLRTF